MVQLNTAAKVYAGTVAATAVYQGATKVWPSTPAAYLDALIGTVTTPDPGTLPNQCVFVFKVRGPTASTYNTPFSQAQNTNQWSWQFFRLASNGSLSWNLFPAGTATGQSSNSLSTQAVTAGQDETLALALTIDNGAGRQIARTHRRTGTTWTPLTADTDAGPAIVPFDGTDPIRIGAYRTNQSPFNGRIYSVELRAGVDPAAGAVLWRFDANEYPGTGLSYVDPRGRTWTLTAANAIVKP